MSVLSELVPFGMGSFAELMPLGIGSSRACAYWHGFWRSAACFRCRRLLRAVVGSSGTAAAAAGGGGGRLLPIAATAACSSPPSPPPLPARSKSCRRGSSSTAHSPRLQPEACSCQLPAAAGCGSRQLQAAVGCQRRAAVGGRRRLRSAPTRRPLSAPGCCFGRLPPPRDRQRSGSGPLP